MKGGGSLDKSSSIVHLARETYGDTQPRRQSTGNKVVRTSTFSAATQSPNPYAGGTYCTSTYNAGRLLAAAGRAYSAKSDGRTDTLT
jgi:hypothetical protein